MKKIIGLTGIWLLVFWVQSAEAGGRYQIEVVVFAQYVPNTELFEQTQSQIHWPKTIVDESVLTQVAADGRLLNGVYGTLARTKGYHPLLHAAWIQEIAANKTGKAIRIQGGNGTVDGYIRLQRGQLLKLLVDLEYQPSTNRYYRLREKRRIKFNERHYFDHPKFGVIAVVKPL